MWLSDIYDFHSIRFDWFWHCNHILWCEFICETHSLLNLFDQAQVDILFLVYLLYVCVCVWFYLCHRHIYTEIFPGQSFQPNKYKIFPPISIISSINGISTLQKHVIQSEKIYWEDSLIEVSSGGHFFYHCGFSCAFHPHISHKYLVTKTYTIYYGFSVYHYNPASFYKWYSNHSIFRKSASLKDIDNVILIVTLVHSSDHPLQCNHKNNRLAQMCGWMEATLYIFLLMNCLCEVDVKRYKMNIYAWHAWVETGKCKSHTIYYTLKKVQRHNFSTHTHKYRPIR